MVCRNLDKKKRSAVGRFRAEFPANSLRIPWWSSETRCLCGFQEGIFFHGKKFPAKFPAQGISLFRELGRLLSDPRAVEVAVLAKMGAFMRVIPAIHP